MYHACCVKTTILLRSTGLPSLRSGIGGGLRNLFSTARPTAGTVFFLCHSLKQAWLVPKNKTAALQRQSNELRRERDSNPRTCNSQRFSRPSQSTTLPSLRVQNNSLSTEFQNKLLPTAKSFPLLDPLHTKRHPEECLFAAFE